MVVPINEIEIKRVREELKVEARAKFEAEKLLLLKRALSDAEKAEMDQLFVAREAWLKKMREMRVQQHGPLTLDQERALNTEVDLLLKTNPAAVLAENRDNAPEPEFKGLLSKVNGVLGKGPFAFVGKILEKIFEMVAFVMPIFKSIMPEIEKIGKMLNPGKTATQVETKPNKTTGDLVQNLISEGKLVEADQLLRDRENKLLAEMQGALPAEATVQQYQEQLGALTRECTAFAGQVTDAYMIDNLKTRVKYFEQYSSEAQEILKLHAEKKVVDDQIREGMQSGRLQVAGTELQGLQQKQQDLGRREELHLNKLPAVITSFAPISQAHQAVYEREIQLRRPT